MPTSPAYYDSSETRDERGARDQLILNWYETLRKIQEQRRQDMVARMNEATKRKGEVADSDRVNKSPSPKAGQTPLADPKAASPAAASTDTTLVPEPKAEGLAPPVPTPSPTANVEDAGEEEDGSDHTHTTETAAPLTCKMCGLTNAEVVCVNPWFDD